MAIEMTGIPSTGYPINPYQQPGVAGSSPPPSGPSSGVQGQQGSVPPASSSGGSSSSGGGVNLAPSGTVGGTSDQRMAELVARIKATAGNAIDFLARAMVEQEGQERHEAVQDRTNMRQMAQASLMSAAHDLENQAKDLVTSAIVSLVITVVTSAASIGMSGAGAP